MNSTGLPFNSVMAIELNADRTMNPLVNAGAMATTSLVPGTTADEKFESIAAAMSRFAGRRLVMDDDVYESEAATNDRNRGIVRLLGAGAAGAMADPVAPDLRAAAEIAVTVAGYSTEPAFRNEYWDNKEPGLYVDVVSGEPLFASVNKHDSHTGWPSFTVPVAPGHVIRRRDFRHLMIRTEVRSAHGDSHLGHVFRDGPAEAGGLRYCINSAALRFVPLDDLEREGYGACRHLFEPPTPGAHPDDRMIRPYMVMTRFRAAMTYGPCP